MMLRYDASTTWNLPAELEEAVVEAALELRYFLFPPTDIDSDLALERRAEYAEDTGLGLYVNALHRMDDVSLYVVASLLDLETPFATALAIPLILEAAGSKDTRVQRLAQCIFDSPASTVESICRRYAELDGIADQAEIGYFGVDEDLPWP